MKNKKIIIGIIAIVIIVTIVGVVILINKPKEESNIENQTSQAEKTEEEYNTDEVKFDFYTEENKDLANATVKLPTFNSIVLKATIYSESDENRFGLHAYKLNTTSSEKAKEMVETYITELKKYNSNLLVSSWYNSNGSQMCDVTNNRYHNIAMNIGLGDSSDEGYIVNISIWKVMVNTRK